MPAEMLADRGRRLVDALILWITPPLFGLLGSAATAVAAARFRTRLVAGYRRTARRPRPGTRRGRSGRRTLAAVLATCDQPRR